MSAPEDLSDPGDAPGDAARFTALYDAHRRASTRTSVRALPLDGRRARAATALPGVTAIGEATDPLGRKGVALASASRTVEVTGDSGAPPGQQGTYRARKELVFDKATGAVLASQYVLTKPGGPYKDRERGFVIDYMAVRDTGWTDARPTPPVKPPH